MAESAHDRFERKGGILTVTDANLDEQVRRRVLGVMDLGARSEEMDAVLRCMINHCEAFRASLAKRTPRDTV